jgi:CheY-like chemotaxis protein
MDAVQSASFVAGEVAADAKTAVRTLAVIDDDDLSREVLGLIGEEAGFAVRSFGSGEEAIAALDGVTKAKFILCDMQMPGICGIALAEKLRGVCGTGTVLLAMSGSKVAPEKLIGYDGFLLKPFSADELRSMCNGRAEQLSADAGDGAAILNETVFGNFARGMPAGQVFGLYKMCLDDCRRRLTTMRHALEIGDDPAYRRAAHAIKGGCGMVGAIELAKLADAMESGGLPPDHDAAALDHFVAASERLGRMLERKAKGDRADSSAVRP